MLGASGRAARRIRALIALPQVSLSCGGTDAGGGGSGPSAAFGFGVGGALSGGAGGSLVVSRIVTGSADGTVRVYVAATGAREAKLAAHKGAVKALAAFPDGAHVASGGEDGVVHVWSIAGGHRGAAAPAGAGDAAASRATSTGSTGSAGAAADGGAQAGTTLPASDGHAPVVTLQPGGPAGPGSARGGVNAMAVLPSGLLAVAYGDSSIVLWRLHKTHAPLAAPHAAAGAADAQASAGTSASAITASASSSSSSASGEVAQRLRLRAADIVGGATAWGSAPPMGLGAIASLAALSDGRLVAGTDAGCVCVWEPTA